MKLLPVALEGDQDRTIGELLSTSFSSYYPIGAFDEAGSLRLGSDKLTRKWHRPARQVHLRVVYSTQRSRREN